MKKFIIAMILFAIAAVFLLVPLSIYAAEVSQIIVPVSFTYNGRTVTAPMAVDTGASVTTIDPVLADRLGVFGCTGSGVAQMADGSTAKYCSVPMDVTVSTMSRRDVRVNIMPYAGTRDGVRGMLGLNFLADSTLTLDWRNKRIYWSE